MSDVCLTLKVLISTYKINFPNWSLYIFLKNVLREFDKRSRHFLLVIILLILITFSFDDVWISLGENWWWSPLGPKGLRTCRIPAMLPIWGLLRWLGNYPIHRPPNIQWNSVNAVTIWAIDNEVVALIGSSVIKWLYTLVSDFYIWVEKIWFVVRGWSYKRGDRRAGFHCIV